MTPPPLPLLDNQTLVVSPTQLEVIRTCPRQWLYRYLYRRIPVTPSYAAVGGRAFDDALNYRYRTCGNRAVDAATEAEMLAIVDRAYEGVDVPLEEYRTPARYKEVVQAYNQFWQAEPFEVLGVQVPFAVVLGSVEVPSAFWYAVAGGGAVRPQEHPLGDRVQVVLQGILDLVVRLAGHVYIVDTKTGNSDNGSAYDNSAQMKAYCWAIPEVARQNPGLGLPEAVHAALINQVIIRPPYKQAGRTPKPSDKPRNEFHRPMASFYSPERLEEWRADTLAWVEGALGWVARGHFPQNERHCTFHADTTLVNYGTYGRQCPYLGVCSVPVEQREMVLGTDEFMEYGRGPLGLPVAKRDL